MQHRVAYSQLPSTIVFYQPKTGLTGFLFKLITNILAILGLLLVSGLLVLYFQGQEIASSFDDEFIGFFGKFVGKVTLNKDVASAMLIKNQLESNVTIEQAIKAMKAEAKKVNLKLIRHYPLHEEIQATTGKSSPYVEIFEFCDATVVLSLLEHNPDFAAYLPCRIALYNDNSDKTWFATLDIVLLLHGTQTVKPWVKTQALKIQEQLLKIMSAGAHGI
ncbi:conserved hypothetical protein [Beggiatoa sp. PS]|nr:conserved hypothetical protein [Beggiatoa sp. PS]